MNVTIWNENVHERTEDHVRAIYPDGIHGALAAALADLGHRAGRRRSSSPSTGCPPRCSRAPTC